MTREAIGAALLLLGAVVLRLTITGEYLSFVKASLMIPLLLSALVLLVLGGLELRASIRTDEPDEPDEHDGHDGEHGDRLDRDSDGAPTAAVGASGTPAMSDAFDPQVGEHAGHHHAGAGPRMGALLLAPLAVLMLVPAAPLGAFAADAGAANRVPDISVFDELEATEDGGPVEVVLPEIVGRALIEPETIADRRLRTIGFVVPDEAVPGTYRLSRFTVGCCAVDAVPYQLRVEPRGAGVPDREQWVEVVLEFTGQVDEVDGERMPVFAVVEQQLIDEPDVSYVY